MALPCARCHCEGRPCAAKQSQSDEPLAVPDCFAPPAMTTGVGACRISKGKADPDGAGDRRAGAVAAWVCCARGLGDEHRGSRRESTEGIVLRVECVLDQAEE